MDHGYASWLLRWPSTRRPRPRGRAELVGRRVGATEIQVYSEDGLRPSREGESLDNVGFVYFDDPDGNGWTVQQISSRG